MATREQICHVLGLVGMHLGIFCFIFLLGLIAFIIILEIRNAFKKDPPRATSLEDL